MPDHPRPKKITRRQRHERALVAFVLAGLLAYLAPSPVSAATELDGSVLPLSGTTATVFTFTVQITKTSPPQAPSSVTAELTSGNDTVPVPLSVTGSFNGGTWSGTGTGASTLPVGTWEVIFIADGVQASGGEVTVTAPSSTPSQEPTANPTPTPPPTPQPTPDPTDPTGPPSAPPAPTSPPGSTTPPGATPRPPTPAPSASSGSGGSVAGAPSPGGQPPQTGLPAASTTPGDATPAAAAASGVVAVSDEPRDGKNGVDGSPVARAGDEDPVRGRSGSVLPWLLLGGSMATTGAGVLAWQWIALRRRRA